MFLIRIILCSLLLAVVPSATKDSEEKSLSEPAGRDTRAKEGASGDGAGGRRKKKSLKRKRNRKLQRRRQGLKRKQNGGERKRSKDGKEQSSEKGKEEKQSQGESFQLQQRSERDLFFPDGVLHEVVEGHCGELQEAEE